MMSGVLEGGRVRVLLVEDDERLRQALRRALGRADPPVLVAAESGSLEHTRALLADATLQFAVALVDLKLPDGSGLDVIRAIRGARPGVVPLALTVLDDPATILAAIRAGAQGYLIKESTSTQLARHVHEAALGGAPMTPSAARWVLDFVRNSPGEIAHDLTPRELDVLRLLCEGVSYAQAGRKLSISLGTVQTHVRSIYTKLEVNSKAELTALAFRRGLVG